MKKALVFAVLLAVGCSKPRPRRFVNHVNESLQSVVALVQERDEAEQLVEPERGRWTTPYCTAFFVSRYQILTAAHCLREMEDSDTVYYDVYGQINGDGVTRGNPRRARIKYRNADTDVAVLVSERPSRHHLNLANDCGRPGSLVFALGHPVGMSWTITSGLLTGKLERTRPTRRHLLQASASIWYGNSGGVLLNRKGEVIGMCVSLRQVPHLGVFVALPDLRTALAGGETRESCNCGS